MPQGPDFDLSADMRLLELQRQASGRPTRARSWEQRSPDLPDESEIVAERPVVEPRGAVLQIQVTASPERGLIPGALLTVTLAVINESSMSAEGVVVGLPLPAAARARTGSLSLDERALDERAIESVTGEGFSLGTLAAGERRTLKWQLEVGAGTAPLLLAPFAHSKNAAMLGAKPLRLTRGKTGVAFVGHLREQLGSLPPAEVTPVPPPPDERPFYELDDEETIEYEATEAALSTAAPRTPPAASETREQTPRQARRDTEDVIPSEGSGAAEVEGAAPPDTKDVIPSEGSEAAKVEGAAPPDTEDVIPSEGSEAATVEEAAPQAQPAVSAASVSESVQPFLYRRIDRASLAFFERSFAAAKGATLITHALFVCSLACVDEGAEDTLAHLDAQSQLLHRIVLHAKLGRAERLASYAGSSLMVERALRPAQVAPQEKASLRRSLEPALTESIAKASGSAAPWDFHRARRLELSLMADSIVCEAESERDRSIDQEAIEEYRSLWSGALQRLFVRARLEPSISVVQSTEAALDAAGRRLVERLRRALES